jgi:hypothetical protein
LPGLSGTERTVEQSCERRDEMADYATLIRPTGCAILRRERASPTRAQHSDDFAHPTRCSHPNTKEHFNVCFARRDTEYIVRTLMQHAIIVCSSAAH